LEIHSAEGKNIIVTTDIDTVKFIYNDSALMVISSNIKSNLLRAYEKLKKDNRISDIKLAITDIQNQTTLFSRLTSVKPPATPATYIKPAGEIFIRLLSMIAVPLVLASLITGAASLGEFRQLVKIGGKTLGLFLLGGTVAVATGQIIATVLQPGAKINSELRNNIVESHGSEGDINYRLDITEFFVNIVPRNPFKAIAEGDFLQIVFFAVISGLILHTLPVGKSAPVIRFFEGISSAMIKLVEKVVLLAPFAVFALISSVVAEFGFEIISTLFWYALSVILSLLIVAFVLYPSLVRFLANVNPVDFFRAQRRVLAVAFTTSSSSATLPVTIDVTENRLGVPNKIASFVLPLGTTLNKAGTALYQAVAALFIAQVWGYELSAGLQLTIFITSVITGAATAPVAGAGLVMLVVILKSAGLPEEGIALIVGIDRIINMCRTTVNVLGDTVTSVIIAKSEGELGKIIPENED
jgi:Na+/H+-dicarboxylate symporter